MQSKQKQKILFRIFWLEMGVNFLVIAMLFTWLMVNKSQKSLANRLPAAIPMVLGAVSEPVRGQEAAVTLKHFEKVSEPSLTDITAKSFLVYNAEDGLNLLEKNINQKLGIASLTKLLTAYTAYQYLDLTSEVKVTSLSGPNINPSLGLVPGDTVKLLDLFNAMLVGSENDAAEMIAQKLESKTGQSAENSMNQLAISIGMNDSHFGNPFGFDFGNNYSTVNDLKKLIIQTQSLYAFKNLENSTSYSFRGESGGKYFAKATNRLIGTHPNIYAIKTGYTETTLGSMAIKTYLEDRPVIVVLVGSQNREKDTLRLIEEVQKHFKLVP